MAQTTDNDETQSEKQPAGLFIRLAAIAYDGLLLIAVLFLATWVFLQFANAEENRLIFQIYLLTVCFLYFAWHWLHGGQTLGMKTWRLQLQSVTGQKITWQQTIIRFIVSLLSWMVAGVGFLRLVVDKEKRSWQDEASKTQIFILPK